MRASGEIGDDAFHRMEEELDWLEMAGGGLALAGPQNTGKIMAWVGTAMYAAFAIGAPAGTALYAGYGFAAIALATTLTPLVSLLLVAPRRTVAPLPHTRPKFNRVIGAVWVPGLGLALSSVGFGAITTFIVLLFAQHGWGQAWLAFTLVSITFMAGRLIFGHLPDRIGGTKVALVCVLIEAAGQALIWLAPLPALALLGAAVTGFGYSLVYPASAWKRSVTHHRRAAASPWEPTLPFWIWRWESLTLCWAWLRAGPA
jgi:predicted MFS family arabinose efflux permease